MKLTFPPGGCADEVTFYCVCDQLVHDIKNETILTQRSENVTKYFISGTQFLYVCIYVLHVCINA